MWIELRSIVEKISSSDIRVIVLSSTTDKYFTAGLDRGSYSSSAYPQH
jgi:enoyl-CoA hydratase/carnithine racemase